MPTIAPNIGQLDIEKMFRNIVRRLTALEANDTGWIDLPLINNWAHYDTTFYGKARYRRKNGIVYLQGLVHQPIAGQAGFTICTLPVGFRPLRVNMVAQATHVGMQRLDMEPNGNLTFISGTGATGGATYYSVTMSYPADQ